MNFTSFYGSVRAIKFGIGFLNNGRPHFNSVFATFCESGLVTRHWDVIVDNDILKVPFLMELKHEATCFLPVVWIAFVLVVVVFLTFEETDSALVTKHRQR